MSYALAFMTLDLSGDGRRTPVYLSAQGRDLRFSRIPFLVVVAAVQSVRRIRGDIPGSYDVLLARVIRRPCCREYAGGLWQRCSDFTRQLANSEFSSWRFVGAGWQLLELV